MSLLALLASTGTLTPPGDGGGPPPGRTDPRPLLDDAFAMSIRPDGECVAIVEVGPTRTYTTVRDGLDRATLLRNANLQAAGKAMPNGGDVAWANLRNYRVDVLIDPGVYPETSAAGILTVGQHIGLYARSGGRDVFIYAGFDEAGGWNYGEGLTLIPPQNTAKYPVHQEQNGTNIWNRCTFEPTLATQEYSGSGMPFGMDGADHGYVLLYDCDLLVADGPSVARTALHTWSSSTAPMTACVINSRFAGGGLAFDTLNSTIVDDYWAVGNSCAWVGYGTGGPQSVLHSSGNTVDGPPPGSYLPANDARSDWPVPTGGLSTYWRTQLGL